LIVGATVIDGTGRDPESNRSILIRGRKIVSIASSGATGADPDAIVVDVEGRTVLPGLIDCHTHLGGTATTDYGQWVIEDDRRQAIVSTIQLRELMQHGITAIRDISRNGIRLKWAVNQGLMPGPHIVSCGPGLTRTGGHGDAWHLPVEMVQESHPWGLLADGPEELRKAVRTLNRMGSDSVKVWATGGGMWENEPETDQHYTMEELEMIVREATLSNLPVLAHAESLAASKDAIRAGVWTIEHGEDLDDECRALMIEKGITHVPTLQLFLGPWFDSYEPAIRPGLEAYPGATLVDKEKARVTENFMKSVEAGVPIAVGSDSFSSVEVPFGESTLEEMRTMARVGMPVLDVIRAATLNGAQVLRIDDRTGSVEVGKDADLIVFDAQLDTGLDEGLTRDHLLLSMRRGAVWKDEISNLVPRSDLIDLPSLEVGQAI
jgi:imidazolonepropionase-like amidohydrolase